MGSVRAGRVHVRGRSGAANLNTKGVGSRSFAGFPGQALAGAGGGGFLVAITKEPNAHASVEALVRAAGAAAVAGAIVGSDDGDNGDADGGEPVPQWTVHRAAVDLDGLRVWTQADGEGLGDGASV